MIVRLVTTWDIPCGIAEHSAHLIAAVERGQANPEIEVIPDQDALDPMWLLRSSIPTQDVLWLNYHAALHSRWTPEMIRRFKAEKGVPVGVTYHDSGVPNSDQCKAVVAAADVAVVHEPFDDLPTEKTHYLRMGVPAATVSPYHFGAKGEWGGDWGTKPECFFKAYRQQPVVGTIGFPFPWKNQILAAEVAASVGWGFCCICPTADDDYVAKLKAANPDIYIRTDFVPSEEAIRILSSCDATVFPYVTHNAGQSGAILQGIAARKPVIAFWTCRQFRALFEGDGDRSWPQVQHHPITRDRAIRWCETFEDMASSLRSVDVGRVDTGIVALAHRESWANVGATYAELFRSVVS